MRYCTRCGSIGHPRTITPGYFLVEVALWLCFLLPGFIYSGWRIAARKPGCGTCGATHGLKPPPRPGATIHVDRKLTLEERQAIAEDWYNRYEGTDAGT